MIPPRARLGTVDVAAMLGCSRAWVARQCASQTFPCLFVAGRYRFTPEDVAVILARVRRPSRAPPELARLTFRDELPADAAPVQPRARRRAIDWRTYAKVTDDR